MLTKNNLKLYRLSKFFNIYFSYKKSLLFLKGFYGIIILKLPSYYFYNNNFINTEEFSFIFLKRFFFLSLVKLFFVFYNRLLKVYCIRLRIRGLGYRIRKISSNLYYFFFNYTNMFYLHIPNNVLIKWYKKRIILLSNDFFILKLLFSHILLLKKVGPYRLLGLKYPRQIILLKKSAKKI